MPAYYSNMEMGLTNGNTSAGPLHFTYTFSCISYKCENNTFAFYIDRIRFSTYVDWAYLLLLLLSRNYIKSLSLDPFFNTLYKGRIYFSGIHFAYVRIKGHKSSTNDEIQIPKKRLPTFHVWHR